VTAAFLRWTYVLALAPGLGISGCGGGTGDASASATGTGSTGTTAGPPTTGTTAADPPTSTSGASTGETTSGTASTEGASATSTSSTSESTGAGSTGETGDTGVMLDCVDGVAWIRHIVLDVSTQPVYDMTIDAQGNSYVVGNFPGQADFGGGPLLATGNQEDVYIVKYGPLGEHLWSRRFGDLDEQRLRGVATDGAGNVIVTGMLRGSIDFGGGPLNSAGIYDIMLAKLDADGGHVWSKRFGAPGADFGLHAAADAAGNVVLVAQSEGAIDFGAGPLGAGLAAHVVKFDPTGALLWHRAFSGDVLARDVAVDPDDNIIAVGEFQNVISFDGGPVAASDQNNIFVVKLDPAGKFVWFKQNGGPLAYGKPFVTGVKTDAAGNIRLGGWFGGIFDFGGPQLVNPLQEEFDAWIAALTPDGAHLWISGHGNGGGQWQFVSDVSANAAGQTAVTGNFGGAIEFGGDVFVEQGDGYDAFVARFAADGSHEFSRAFGGPGSHWGDAVAIDDQGSVWISGVFSQPFEAGGELLVPQGDYDAYVLRLCP
jgi:hypothetical protein